MLKRLVLAVLRGLGVPWLVRHLVQRRRVTILLYHDIQPEVAERHWRLLAQRYHFIGLADYLRARREGAWGMLPPYALIITFDDGHRSNAALGPLFERYGIRPTIFLTSSVVGRQRHFWFRHDIGATSTQRLKDAADAERLRVLHGYGYEDTQEYADRQALSRAEIAALRDRVDFQSHTVTHPILPHCPEDKVRAELVESRHALERDYDLAIYALSYPNGDYSERVVALTRAAGYACALAIDGGWNGPTTDLFRLRRISIPDDLTDEGEILLRASGAWDVLKGWVRKALP